MEPDQSQAPSTPAAPMATPETTSTKPAENADNSMLMGILCYLGPLVIIPFLMAKDQPFVRFHVRQGIVLAVIGIILYVIGESVFYWDFRMVFDLLNLACLVLSIIGIINVVQKKEAPLPIIGGLANMVKI